MKGALFNLWIAFTMLMVSAFFVYGSHLTEAESPRLASALWAFGITFARIGIPSVIIWRIWGKRILRAFA